MHLFFIFGNGKEKVSQLLERPLTQIQRGLLRCPKQSYFLYCISTKSSYYSRSKARLFCLAEPPIE